MPEQTHATRIYWLVYLALLLLLITTVGLSFVDFGRWINNGIAMAIACIKGLLIILFFMHVRWRPWLTWFFVGAGFLWLGILFTLTASDYLTRNHPPGGSPKGEPVFLRPLGQ
jgi:cytochrome c oxidase subunit 4